AADAVTPPASIPALGAEIAARRARLRRSHRVPPRGAHPAAAPTQPREASLAARRDRRPSTTDELTYRVQPRTILHRQTEAAKARFADAATTPEGDLRVEGIPAVVPGA